MRYTRKKGGKYIAQGSYGCVFGNPPLKCKNENTRRSNIFVSKLQNTPSTENEFLESKEWHTIDPTNKFSLTPIKRCDYDGTNIQPTNNMEKCTARMAVGQKQLLLYKHGGTDLYDFKVRADNYNYLFSAFYDLLKGLDIAHKNNLIHSDIKPENILAKMNDTNIHLRFIDFGMSYKITDKVKLNTSINGGYLNALYLYWPLEIKFLINDNLENDRFIYDSLNNYINMITTKLRFIVPRAVLLNKKTNSVYTYTDIKEIYKNNNLKKYLTKLDVYSMGITICQLASYYFKQYMTVNSEYKDIIKVILPDLETPVELDDLDISTSRHVTHEVIEWHKTIAEHVTKPLYTLMLKLLDIDPIKRLTAEEAAEEYKTLLPSFSKYLSDEKMIEKIYDAYPDFLDKSPRISNPPTPSVIVSPIPVPSEAKPSVNPTLKRQLSNLNNRNRRNSKRRNSKRIKLNNK